MRVSSGENVGHFGDGIGSDHSGYGHTLLNLEPILGIVPQYDRDSAATVGKGGVCSLHIYPQRERRRPFFQPMSHYVQPAPM